MTHPANAREPATIPPAELARNNGRVLRWALGAAAVLAMCLLGLVLLAVMVGSIGAVPLLFGVVFAVLPVPLYLALALWVDRFEKEPAWMLVGAFLWGAAVATLFSLILNRASTSVVSSTFGQEAAAFFTTVISAPIVEEFWKGLALFILYWWKKDEFDGVLDGIVYAAMVGLGFAAVENFLYYGRAFLFGGAGEAFLTFGLRGVISPFIHPFFTAMTGVGLGLARRSSRISVKLLAPAAGLLAAMFLHSLWNLSGTLLSGPVLDAFGIAGWYALYVLLYTPLILGVLAMVAFALRREGLVVRRNLTPELQDGLLTQPEYDALGSVRGRLGSSVRALRSGGFGGWRAYSRFAQSASELAFHRDRVSRGIISAEDPAREAAYLRRLRERGQRSAVEHTDLQGASGG